MTDNAIYIIKQNKLYNQIIKDLKKLLKIPDEKKQKYIKSLYSDLQNNSQSIEKRNFDVKFKETYQKFYTKLNE